MKISPARSAAFGVLLRVEAEKAFTSVLLPQREEALSDIDRGLCHELVLGTLRRQVYLDRIMDHFSRGKKLDIEVRVALRLGIYQLYFLDKIPAYSAINESVDLVQAARKSSAKGFVNAILRRASEKRPNLSFVDETERVSVETSHPRWLIERWTQQFGAGEASAIAVANNENPATWFRLLKDPTAELRTTLEIARESPNVPGCYSIAGHGAMLNRHAEHGEIYLQDEGSQMIAYLFRDTAGPILDVCAAPGGKAGLIASLQPNSQVVAGDLHGSRVRHLAENCRRQGAAVDVVQHDAVGGLPFGEGRFWAVLVDAPCSGTGTIRRNPEIRYHLEPNDLIELQTKQLAILKNASKVVRPGGVLVYSTCSLEMDENEGVIARFLEVSREFRLAGPAVPDAFVTPEGFARTWPQRDGMDGFFIARMTRNKA